MYIKFYCVSNPVSGGYTIYDYSQWLFVRSRMNISVLFVRNTHVMAKIMDSKTITIHVIHSGDYTWPLNSCDLAMSSILSIRRSFKFGGNRSYAATKRSPKRVYLAHVKGSFTSKSLQGNFKIWK